MSTRHGAQLSFTDHDGYRFQAILTDQDDEDIAVIECCNRQHAHVEDRIRDDKDTGLAKFPFQEFALNEVSLEIVALAHDLIVWTQALVLDGELARAEPKRLRYRLMHVAGHSRSTAAADGCDCNTTGPGPPSSPRPSTSSKHSQPPLADTTAGDHDHQLAAPGATRQRSVPRSAHRARENRARAHPRRHCSPPNQPDGSTRHPIPSERARHTTTE